MRVAHEITDFHFYRRKKRTVFRITFHRMIFILMNPEVSLSMRLFFVVVFFLLQLNQKFNSEHELIDGQLRWYKFYFVVFMMTMSIVCTMTAMSRSVFTRIIYVIFE